jgi:hypothetical protein
MANTTSEYTSDAHTAITALAVEFAGIVVITVVAGLNEQAGTLLLLFSAGLWLLFIIMHSDEFTSLINSLEAKDAGSTSPSITATKPSPKKPSPGIWV